MSQKPKIYDSHVQMSGTTRAELSCWTRNWLINSIFRQYRIRCLSHWQTDTQAQEGIKLPGHIVGEYGSSSLSETLRKAVFFLLGEVNVACKIAFTIWYWFRTSNFRKYCYRHLEIQKFAYFPIKRFVTHVMKSLLGFSKAFHRMQSHVTGNLKCRSYWKIIIFISCSMTS